MNYIIFITFCILLFSYNIFYIYLIQIVCLFRSQQKYSFDIISHQVHIEHKCMKNNIQKHISDAMHDFQHKNIVKVKQQSKILSKAISHNLH